MPPTRSPTPSRCYPTHHPALHSSTPAARPSGFSPRQTRPHSTPIAPASPHSPSLRAPAWWYTCSTRDRTPSDTPSRYVRSPCPSSRPSLPGNTLQTHPDRSPCSPPSANRSPARFLDGSFSSPSLRLLPELLMPRESAAAGFADRRRAGGRTACRARKRAKSPGPSPIRCDTFGQCDERRRPRCWERRNSPLS